MPTIKSFEEMDIWKTARLLNKEIIILLDNEFVKKDFRFRDQIRAASGSIMDNIAEGFERGGRNDEARCGDRRENHFVRRRHDGGQHDGSRKKAVVTTIEIDKKIASVAMKNLFGLYFANPNGT